MLIYLYAGVLGILLHILAVKIPSIKAKSKVANLQFKLKDYLNDDWPAMLASLVSVGIMIVGLNELLQLRPELTRYVRWLFIFVGFTGSSIIQAGLSVANQKIMKIIDYKTNVADNLNKNNEKTTQ